MDLNDRSGSVMEQKKQVSLKEEYEVFEAEGEKWVFASKANLNAWIKGETVIPEP